VHDIVKDSADDSNGRVEVMKRQSTSNKVAKIIVKTDGCDNRMGTKADHFISLILN
jgi:hypothetical protein